MPDKRKTAPARAHAAVKPRRRLSTEEREKQIVEGAVQFFSEHGLAAQMRDLAKEIGITHPLLYHYFPPKQALIERVYEEVYLGRWKREWEQWVTEPDVALEHRLTRFYNDYARTILTRDWVRILLLSGMKDSYIPKKYLALLRRRLFPLIIRETRAHLGLLSPHKPTEMELEHLWGLHGGIFYIGIRVFVYGQAFPHDLDQTIGDRVHAFIQSAGDIFTASHPARSPARSGSSPA
jgi:AcrR family transcriptional regulator